jgi:Flp pilus assembly protein TadG
MRSSEGGGLVELALLMPVFAGMLLTSVEFAFVAYDNIEVADAARAGAAYGSQSSSTASDTMGMQNVAKAAGPDVSGLSATASEEYSCSNSASTLRASLQTCTSGNRVLTYVEVSTTASITPPIRVPGVPSSFTLNGLAIMRVQ